MMASVAENAAIYLQKPHKALEDIREAWTEFMQTYHGKRIEKFWSPRTKAWHDLWYERWEFQQDPFQDINDMEVCERLEFVFRSVVLARKRNPELFGILASPTQRPDIVTWIAEFTRDARGRERFLIDKFPLCGFEEQLDAFEFELRTRGRFADVEKPEGSEPDQEGAENVRSTVVSLVLRPSDSEALSPDPAAAESDGGNATTSGNGSADFHEAITNDESMRRLFSVFTNGVSDDRIQQSSLVLADKELTTNEKLEKIDRLIPFPASTSASQFGELFGVSKQAVMKTAWWKTHRKGEKASEIGRRQGVHRQHASPRDPAESKDDDE